MVIDTIDNDAFYIKNEQIQLIHKNLKASYEWTQYKRVIRFQEDEVSIFIARVCQVDRLMEKSFQGVFSGNYDGYIVSFPKSMEWWILA